MRSAAILSAAAVVCLLATACSSPGTNHTGKDGPELTSHSLPAGLAGVGTLPRAASAWPEAGYDARFSSGTNATGPHRGTVRWKVDLGGAVTPGPVIAADGSILAATNAGQLYDLAAATGARGWVFDAKAAYGTDLSTSPAVLGTGTILWPGPNDTLYALTAKGALLWKHAFAGQVLSPAIAGQHRVYVADLSGGLAALDVSAATPRIVWQTKVGGPDYASPSIGPNGTIYTAADHDLVAVRDLGSSAAVLWRLHTGKLIEVSNGVAPDGTVVLGTNGDCQYGVRPDGRVAWSFEIANNTYSSSTAAASGLAYFGDNNGRVRVVDTRTGEVTRTVGPLGSGGKDVWTAVVVDAHGNFYWATTGGHAYGYDAAGHQLFGLDVGAEVNGYPALGGDGTLYLGTTGGLLYAIGG